MNSQSNLNSQAKPAKQAPTRHGSCVIYVASLFYGILILVIDEEFRSVVLTPILGLWWLMGVAFFRRPREVAIIGAILTCCVLGSLMDESIATFAVRGASFVISSTLAVLFATQKSRAAERFDQISKIIQSVPANVVAMNEQGTIIAASDMAVNVVGDTYRPLIGHVYMDVFLHDSPPATALRHYRELFSCEGRFVCDIQLLYRDSKICKASAECSGTGRSRILVIIF